MDDGTRAMAESEFAMRNRDARREYSRFQAVLMRAKRRGDAEGAQEALREMAHAGAAPTAVQYTTAIAACGRAGRKEDMVRLLNDMRRAGVAPTHHTYAALITGFGRAGDFANAVVAFEKMQAADGLEPTTRVVNELMHASVATGHWAAALKHFDRAAEIGLRPDAVSFNTALHACAVGRQPAQAARIFRAMTAAGVAPDHVTYGTLVRALAAHPDAAPLDEILDGLRRPSGLVSPEQQLSLFVALSAAFAERREPDRALRVIESARQCGLVPPVRCFTQVLHALARAGETGRAAGLLAHMQRSGMQLTRDARATGARALAAECKWRRLAEVVADAERAGEVDDALVCAALRPLLVRRRFADARALVALRSAAPASPDARMRKEVRRAVAFLLDGVLAGAVAEGEAEHRRGSDSLLGLAELLERAAGARARRRRDAPQGS